MRADSTARGHDKSGNSWIMCRYPPGSRLVNQVRRLRSNHCGSHCSIESMATHAVSLDWCGCVEHEIRVVLTRVQRRIHTVRLVWVLCEVEGEGLGVGGSPVESHLGTASGKAGRSEVGVVLSRSVVSICECVLSGFQVSGCGRQLHLMHIRGLLWITIIGFRAECW